MDLRIDTHGGPRSRAREVWVDGARLLVTSKEVVRSLALEDGPLDDTTDLAARIRAEEPEWARERALRLLGYRERSVGELRRRLAEDGYSPATIDLVVERLTELGLVDDARFAEMFIRTKHASGWGRRRIAEGLRRASVNDEVSAHAFDRTYPDDDEQRARDLASRVPVATPRDADRLAARLIRRGFEPRVARSVAFGRLDED